uniref:Uncharacterized protein n=1 Tax=Glossina palpalis gambiensis TaxID=67801 RepID=A0A1B0BMG7_9MUSC
MFAPNPKCALKAMYTFFSIELFFIMKPGNCRGASLKCNNIRSKSSSSSVIPLNFLSIFDFICDAGESTKSVKAAFCIPSYILYALPPPMLNGVPKISSASELARLYLVPPPNIISKSDCPFESREDDKKRISIKIINYRNIEALSLLHGLAWLGLA